MKIPVDGNGQVEQFEDNGSFSTFFRLSDALTVANEELRAAGADYAQKRNAYHAAKAKAFLQAFGKNAQEREANAFAGFQAEMLAADIAEAYSTACLERVRSLRAQLAAYQTYMAAQRAEAESVKYGQVRG